MAEVSFIDTTLRDGAQSLWAAQMSTSMMLSVIEDLDAAGFESLEFASLAGRYMRCVEEFKEDPRSWLQLGPVRVKHTALRWHGDMGGATESAGTPRMGKRVATQSLDEIRDRLVTEQGILTTRASDPWNDCESLALKVRNAQSIGVQTVANLIYAISPRHTDDYYVERATCIAAIKPYRMCFKDVSGILTPERARALFPRLVGASGEVEWEFHAHSCTAMALACIPIAVECGITHIHTGIPPLANGDAQPSIFAAVRNLNELGHATSIDLEPLKRASEKLYAIANRHHFPIGAPVELDNRHYGHQIPGGMISHLVHQLDQVGQTHRLDEVLDETARVREDFGYPIMVTPLSQFVGSQAAINVITGERYDSVTDQVIAYAVGRYGGDVEAIMDPDVRGKVLNRKRTDELQEIWARPDRTIDELRAMHGDVTDEELFYIYSCGEGALELIRGGSEVEPYRFDRFPEAKWLRDLPRRESGTGVIEVLRGDVTMRVGIRGNGTERLGEPSSDSSGPGSRHARG